ncbi:hypothetical protein [Pseudooceanicola algae]|uniref:Lipoprotein n=1 Tax=Pseudooceanicola algae TaxID=1537215 RepID=A0A418SKG3_9RHOB|nr:hypothetical protein [Pseudooceanicola algae]QPM90708.1 hypothetical protein PSAL_019470 [Pseudooceanicola algae]
MPRLFTILAALTLGITLSACAPGPAPVDVPTSGDAVTRGPWHDDEAPSLTLVTVRNNSTGNGGHTALKIVAEETVIFDPAGSFHHEQIRREGDVLIGIDPTWWEAYKSMHARETFNVLTQRVEVSPEVASRALALAKARGRVGSAYCANSTSSILRQLPGFESIGVTFFPVTLSDEFADLTGVEGTVLYEDFTPPGSVAETPSPATGS